VRRRLRPLSFSQTRQMIRYRLAVAAGNQPPAVSFSLAAMTAIHLACGGSPRKTVRLCHMSMLEMLVRGGARVGLSEVRAAARPDGKSPRTRRAVGLATIATIGIVFGGLWLSLKAQGPVLAPGHSSATSAQQTLGQPFGQAAGQPGGEPAAQPATTDIPAAGTQAEGSATPDAREASLRTEGLSLRPDQADAPEAPTARVSLLPQRDQGPDVRSKVDTTRPPLLQVDAREGATAAAQASLAAPVPATQLAQKAAYSPAGR